MLVDIITLPTEQTVATITIINITVTIITINTTKTAVHLRVDIMTLPSARQ